MVVVDLDVELAEDVVVDNEEEEDDKEVVEETDVLLDVLLAIELEDDWTTLTSVTHTVTFVVWTSAWVTLAGMRATQEKVRAPHSAMLDGTVIATAGA